MSEGVVLADIHKGAGGGLTVTGELVGRCLVLPPHPPIVHGTKNGLTEHSWTRPLASSLTALGSPSGLLAPLETLQARCRSVSGPVQLSTQRL